MTRPPRGLDLPAYFRYYNNPVKMLPTPDGGLMTWRFNPETGGWRAANDIVDEILFSTGGDIHTDSLDSFIQHLEAERGIHIQLAGPVYLDGDGPVYPLYETINAIRDRAKQERRDLTIEEYALVTGLRRKTYAMFEAELARRGDPGADVEAAREAGLLEPEEDSGE